MSTRRQFPLIATVVCAVLAGGLTANVARAQCSHAGGHHHHSGFAPGLLQQQLQQQHLLLQQQQQLLQQVQQQQQLQTAKLKRQMRELAKEGPEAIKAALKNPDADMRLVAALVAGKTTPALTDDLIPLLTDDNALVRQAARRSLVSLSTKRDGKPTGLRGVDFGPVANANAAAQKTAARKWTAWFVRQQKPKDNLKTIPFRDLALNDLLKRPQKPKDDVPAGTAKATARSPAPAKDALVAPVAVNQKTRP
jgi:Spy/CpxP family protein refolding chaperone